MAVHIKNMDEFKSKLADAGNSLVVVDFFATWCGPCKLIAPKIEEMSAEYPAVIFLKVDVDECEDIASEYEITAMPTFVFIKKASKVDAFSGANADKVKEYIIKYM